MAKKKFYGSYEGMSETRKQERKDGSMLSEDKNAVANMPQNVKYVAWPRADRGLECNMDDTINGVNEQMDMDLKGARKNKHHTSY